MEAVAYSRNKEENQMLRELRKRVKKRVKSIPENRTNYLKIKVILLNLVYFGCYFIAIFNGDKPWLYISMYLIMGLDLVLLYLNVYHEAAHNNIYKKKIFNKLALSGFDLVGANSYIWQKRHIESHHNYPNVDGWDTDVEQSGPIKIFPHVKAKGMQKYQHKYILFAYPFYLFNWMLNRDFKDFFDKSRIIYKVHGPIPAKEKTKAILFKVFYLFYQVAIPILFLNVSFGLAFGAWVIEVFAASIFALFVLLPLHPLPDNAFPLPDEDNNLPYSWLRHQLKVTNDLTQNSWFVRHVLGNFNFHVAHHLFPNYHYAYYNEITDEIEKFAEEKGLVYKRFPLQTALSKHYNLLKMNAHDVKPLQHVFEGLDS